MAEDLKVGNRTIRINRPDKVLFPDDGFAEARYAAGLLHELLGDLGLPSAVMTTGSRGLHVLVPLIRKPDFDAVRAFAREAAELLAERHPDRLTTEASKAGRRGRLYLDVQRNAYAQTAVAPYSVRALPGAPVATPLAWSELQERGLDAQRWTMATIGERLRAADPWDGVLRHGHALDEAGKRLTALRSES